MVALSIWFSDERLPLEDIIIHLIKSSHFHLVFSGLCSIAAVVAGAGVHKVELFAYSASAKLPKSLTEGCDGIRQLEGSLAERKLGSDKVTLWTPQRGRVVDPLGFPFSLAVGAGKRVEAGGDEALFSTPGAAHVRPCWRAVPLLSETPPATNLRDSIMISRGGSQLPQAGKLRVP
jgi:hypothetical protein